MRLSEQQFASLRPATSKPQFARGGRVRHQAGTKNKTEARFEQEYILPRIHTGELLDYWFEEIKFKLADNTFYTPDYALQDASGYLSLIDVKGTTRVTRKDGSKAEKAFAEDDALVKIKLMPFRFPFPIFVAYRGKEGWVLEQK